ncbi:MAG TPA: OsmC family protein [bacterium]|nr:OsmC family protein [bacterium]
MIKRKGTAQWQGNLKDGKGNLQLGSGAFEGAYSFTSRFEDGAGTNPEELIGAAHAGCFSMALSNILSEAGFIPDKVATNAEVNLGKVDGNFKITRITLDTEVDVNDISEEEFLEYAKQAKDGCPVSQALKGVEIDLKATLTN